MTPSQREAHLRLLSSLPVRTHLRKADVGESRQGIHRGRAIYRGNEYPSLSALRRIFRISHQKAEEMISRGEIMLV